jgi:RNA polymerase sigma factor (sigma-70 family)
MEDEPSVIQEIDRDRRRRGRRNRNTRVLHHLPLVRHVVRRIRPASSPPELDDLVSAGTIGLIEAVDRYDPQRGVTFASFAYRRIRGAVIEEISSLGAGTVTTSRGPCSLEAPISEETGFTLMDVTVDPSASEPQCSAELSELLTAIGDLPDRDREILALSVAGHTGNHIAERYGCSPSLVSRILVDARFRLEHETQHGG